MKHSPLFSRCLTWTWLSLGLIVQLFLEVAHGGLPSTTDLERIDLGDGVFLEMIRVKPGAFVIGSPETEQGRRDNELQHQMRITKPFYLGKFEVTQAVWERVMTAPIHESPTQSDGRDFYWEYSGSADLTNNPRPSRTNDPQRPVDSVSWRQCQEFIARLNLLVDGGGFRLPTEAEWEYAARAGSTTAYTFGDDADKLADYAWYKANSGGTTHPVGSKLANPWGFHDLYGNVWEFCEDKLVEPYAFPGTGELSDYCFRGPPGGGNYQVIRGGSFAFSARLCRSASRSGFDAWDRIPDVGLRLARNIKTDTQSGTTIAREAGHPPSNLLSNPGFEISRKTRIYPDSPAPWGELLNRGVQIKTGDAVPMPIAWLPNPSSGWKKDSNASYRLVTGQPGQAVHTGNHALYVSSTRHADVMSGVGFYIREHPEDFAQKKTLPIGEPFSFSFFAKGQGTVACRLYTYPVDQTAYGLYKAMPTQFTLTDQWQKYEGTLMFTHPGPMYDARFVIQILKGEATLDDVELCLTRNIKTD